MTAFYGSVSAASKPGHEDFFESLLHDVLGYGVVSNQVTGSNVGDGTLTGADGRANAITESITLTAQAGGTAFSVVGSISGAMDDAYVDHTYDNGIVTFLLNTGGVGFDEGDDFTFDVTEGNAKTDGTAWTLLYKAGGGSEGSAWIQAPGNSSDDNIYLWLRHFKSVVNSRYNIEWATCTSWEEDDAADPSLQAGFSDYVYTTLWQNAMDYWLVVNEQRIAFDIKVNTNYMSFYGGFFLPAALPNEYPIPLCIGSCSSDSTSKHTDTGDGHSNPFGPLSTDNFRLREIDGTWRGGWSGNDYYMHPYEGQDSNPESNEFGDGPGGSYLPQEIILHGDGSAASPGIHGTLDGVYFVSGENNSSENDFVLGSSTYLCFQDIFRTTRNSYHALKME